MAPPDFIFSSQQQQQHQLLASHQNHSAGEAMKQGKFITCPFYSVLGQRLNTHDCNISFFLFSLIWFSIFGSHSSCFIPSPAIRVSLSLVEWYTVYSMCFLSMCVPPSSLQSLYALVVQSQYARTPICHSRVWEYRRMRFKSKPNTTGNEMKLASKWIFPFVQLFHEFCFLVLNPLSLLQIWRKLRRKFN